MLLASIPEKKIVSTQTGLADRTTIGTLVRSSFLRNRQKLGGKTPHALLLNERWTARRLGCVSVKEAPIFNLLEIAESSSDRDTGLSVISLPSVRNSKIHKK